MIAAAKVIYVGEMHTNLQAHEAQRRVIEELEQRFPGQIAIGMEMFREPQQPALDRWTRGELAELAISQGVEVVRQLGLRLRPLPRHPELCPRPPPGRAARSTPRRRSRSSLRQAGAGPLPPEVAAKVPETDFTDPFQRALLEAIFKGHSAGGRTRHPERRGHRKNVRQLLPHPDPLGGVDGQPHRRLPEQPCRRGQEDGGHRRAASTSATGSACRARCCAAPPGPT